eukprot:1474278-Rhodomonas_salina.1
MAAEAFKFMASLRLSTPTPESIFSPGPVDHDTHRCTERRPSVLSPQAEYIYRTRYNSTLLAQFGSICWYGGSDAYNLITKLSSSSTCITISITTSGCYLYVDVPGYLKWTYRGGAKPHLQ